MAAGSAQGQKEALAGAMVESFSDITVDRTHAEASDNVVCFMADHELFGPVEQHRPTYLQEAIVASTFGRLCGPSQPAAELSTRRDAELCTDAQLPTDDEPSTYDKPSTYDEQVRRAARFTAIFLYLDDTTNPTVMADDRWRGFHDALMSTLDKGPGGTTHPALREWLEEFDAPSRQAPTARADFDASFADYCRSLDDERGADLSAMTEAEFWALRRRTIFVEPYLDHWRVSMGLEVKADDAARDALHQGQALARDLIILANDLGSLQRDSTSETTEMSVVLWDVAERGCSLEAGAAAARQHYDQLLEQLRTQLDRLRDEAPWGPRFADLIGRVVDGNLDTMVCLGQRYAQSTRWLDGLARLGEPADAPAAG